MRLAPLSYFCTCWKVRPSAAASFSWLIASIRRRIRTRLPTCWSVRFGAFFAANCKRTATAEARQSYKQKIVGTFDIPIQRAIFGRRSVRIRLFWTTTCIFWTAICGFMLWDRNQSVQGAIVRENDADRNSRTCLAARSARRDDSRRDLGRDRAKEAA